jgi:hypothetical protein
MGDRDHVRYVANNVAWFAAVSPRIPVTCALHRVGRSGARLAMSSPWHNGEAELAAGSGQSRLTHSGHVRSGSLPRRGAAGRSKILPSS